MDKKIIILKDGPYKILGNIPLYKGTIDNIDGVYYLKEGDKIETDEIYFLCRCGLSSETPFCDRSHLDRFDGTLNPPKRDYIKRAHRYANEGLSLLDDDSCVMARLCHRDGGLVWDLAEKSEGDANARKEAIIGASACPSGRLTIQFEDGSFAENSYEASIFVVDDPEKNVGAGLFVRGNIPLVGEDGTEYEIRNRYALCRCGGSGQKPFCDMKHIDKNFKG